LVADPAPEHGILSGAPDDAVLTVTLDQVDRVDFGPRNFAAGYRHSGLDQFGARWTIDRTEEHSLRSGWKCEDGRPGMILGRLAPGEDLDVFSGGREQFVTRKSRLGLDVMRNSNMEHRAILGHRRQLAKSDAELAALDEEFEELAERRERLENRIHTDRWLLGITDVEPANLKPAK